MATTCTGQTGPQHTRPHTIRIAARKNPGNSVFGAWHFCHEGSASLRVGESGFVCGPTNAGTGRAKQEDVVQLSELVQVLVERAVAGGGTGNHDAAGLRIFQTQRPGDSVGKTASPTRQRPDPSTHPLKIALRFAVKCRPLKCRKCGRRSRCSHLCTIRFHAGLFTPASDAGAGPIQRPLRPGPAG